MLGLIMDKPQSFPPRVIYAKLLRASNAQERALAAYTEALAAAPKEPPQEFIDIMAECHADIAELRFGKKELTKAEDELREALRLRPKTVRYMLQLVQVLLEAKQKSEAKRVLDEARQIAPDHEGVKNLTLLFESP